MDAKLVERAVKELSDVLRPVLEISYAIPTPPKADVLETAMAVNKQLGYDLFDDLYYPRLVHDFALVSRMVAHNAMQKKGV